ncbi:MAG: sulfatase-like hydrolase/transferase [Opitutales bacterium]|nr:sulfatase-like hydrolase/transferase [Opitutales bacterium]
MMFSNARRSIHALGLLAGLAVTGFPLYSAEGDGAKETRPPNILFILADDLGYGDLQSYGNPYLETPNLNRLAAEGMSLTDHYAPSPLCAPSRAGFLTGRYNHRTGGIDVSSNRGIDRIALDELTFGDYFRHAGYATALIGKWHNGLYNREYLPHNRGFDLFYGFANGEMDYWKWHLQRNDTVESHDGRYLTDAFNDETIAFIREHREEPFAVFLAHLTPHFPLQAPQELIDKYVDIIDGRYDKSVAILYAMIEAMDSGLGRVFDELRDLGLWENTVVVFTSDNGAILGQSRREGESMYRYNGGFSGRKGLVLEQGIRVPAMVSWPGRISGGGWVTAPVHGCDWLPTLFALTGADKPEGAKPFDGIDMLALLQGADGPEWRGRALPFQKNRYTPVAHSGAAIRAGEWKLYWPAVRDVSRKDIPRDNVSFERGVVRPHWEMPIDAGLPDYGDVESGPPRLYNLVDDPAERHDRAADYPEIVAALKPLYNAWFEDVFADWQAAWERIVAHDKEYWKDRDPPDPAELFRDFWLWDRVDADAGEDDPLEVFTGFWNYRERQAP